MKTFNKFKLIALLVGCGFVLLCTGLAQGGASTSLPAQMPSLKPIAPLHWTITYRIKQAPVAQVNPLDAKNSTDPDAGKDKNRHLVKEDYQLDGIVSGVTRSYSDGTTQLIYIVRGVGYVSDPIKGGVLAGMLNEGSGPELRFAEKFPGFGWVKKENFVDVVEHEGKKLIHYKQQPIAAKQEPNSSLVYDPYRSSVVREAWIDAETNFPYAFGNGELYGLYQKETAPEGRLNVPAAIEKAVRYYDGYR